MKINFRYKLFVVLCFVLFISCNNNEDNYSLGDIWISLGIIEKQDNGNSILIYLDNNDTLVPVASNIDFFHIKENQRVMVNYTILDEVGNSTKKFWVKINDLYDILFKDIIELTNSNSDSIGNDPVNIDNIWISKNLLNIEFQYIGGDKVHYINLVKNQIDDTKLSLPLELELRHNSNNDTLKYNLKGIVTFDLKSLKISNQDSVKFKVKSIDYEGNEHTFNGTFYY